MSLPFTLEAARCLQYRIPKVGRWTSTSSSHRSYRTASLCLLAHYIFVLVDSQSSPFTRIILFCALVCTSNSVMVFILHALFSYTAPKVLRKTFRSHMLRRLLYFFVKIHVSEPHLTSGWIIVLCIKI